MYYIEIIVLQYSLVLKVIHSTGYAGPLIPSYSQCELCDIRNWSFPEKI